MIVALSVICASIGCTTDTGSQAQEESLEIEIGIPDKDTRRIFLPLPRGGDIFYFKGLQVQEFVMLAIRVKQQIDEAFIEIEVENEDTGKKTTRPAWKDPEPLECTEGWCTLVPVLIPAIELGELSELNGTQLRIRCEMWLDDGPRGEATAEGMLRPQR